MGFMDKAKKLAEQAQEKLDDVQQQFNESQAPTQSPEPAPPPAEARTPPHGDPVAPKPEEGERSDEYAPPKLTGGDPLAG